MRIVSTRHWLLVRPIVELPTAYPMRQIDKDKALCHTSICQNISEPELTSRRFKAKFVFAALRCVL